MTDVREAGAMLSLELEKVRQLLVDHDAGVPPASFADRRNAAIGRIEYVLDSYRTALSQNADGWRDISTAPKDGTWFLAVEPQDHVGLEWSPCEVCRWHRGEFSNSEAVTHAPTHWQPLPTPPEETR